MEQKIHACLKLLTNGIRKDVSVDPCCHVIATSTSFLSNLSSYEVLSFNRSSYGHNPYGPVDSNSTISSRKFLNFLPCTIGTITNIFQLTNIAQLCIFSNDCWLKSISLLFATQVQLG